LTQVALDGLFIILIKSFGRILTVSFSGVTTDFAELLDCFPTPKHLFSTRHADKASERKTASGNLDEHSCPDQSDRLNIQVLYIQRILFDELATRFDILAHQGGEDGFAFGNVFELD
jgi:hypothetical protein